MHEPEKGEIEASCTNIARDLCTDPKYAVWLDAAFAQASTRWYSVVAEVSKQDCPIAEIKELPEEAIRNFVYTCIKAPHFKKTGEVLFLFKLANAIWNSTISVTPAPIDTETIR